MVAPPPLSHTDYNDSTPLPSLALFFAFGAVFALVCFITLAFVAPPVMRFCVSVCESGSCTYLPLLPHPRLHRKKNGIGHPIE